MMVGPDTPQINRYLNESGVAQTGVRKRFRLQGTNIVIFPTPAAIETLVYEYVSNKWARSRSPSPRLSSRPTRTRRCSIPDLMRAEIKWRYLAAKGMAFDDARAEAMTIRESRVAADLGGGGCRWHRRRGPNSSSSTIFPTIPGHSERGQAMHKSMCPRPCGEGTLCDRTHSNCPLNFLPRTLIVAPHAIVFHRSEQL